MPRAATRTFLFADLREYTRFIETRGDAAASKMVRAFRTIVRAALKASRGAEIRTEGDSFYVVFGSPVEAIRCAVRIRSRAAAHSMRHPDLPVRLGIGINTGEAVEHDGDFVGAAVVIAARLAQQAPAGAVLVSDTVRSLVRTSAVAPLRDAGAWTLKGVSEPVRVYEVEAGKASTGRALTPSLRLPALLQHTPASATSGLIVCPELVQREGPLAALLEHLGAAATGESRIIALSGEGGVGKSRIARELANLAHSDGFYVFGGRSHATGAPYEPFVAALRPYAHARGTEVLRRLLGALVAELRRLLPEFEAGDASAREDAPDEERRERFLRTIHLLLEDAAAQRPVLLVLEDFHDADVASRDLLRYLASSFRAGICILLTYRDEEVGPAHPLRALLVELDRDRRLARVELSPLDRAGVERMTAALLPGRDVSALARAVYERSEGIPFYVEELLKTALDDPDADPDRLALPRTVADSVRVRVGRLAERRGGAVADLLEAAAVAGVPLGYGILVRLSERGEADAAADIGAAVEAQLLERPPTTTELYQFRHALTREAVEAGIAPARKRRLHARVAAALESEGDPVRIAALLARHWSAAGERAKALGYARVGAENAVRVGAYATAIDLLRDAAVMASGTNEEAAVLEELAVALQAAGRAAEAEEAVERARHLARQARETDRLARLDVRLASVLRMQGRRAEAIAAVKRAIAALEPRGGAELAEAVATHAALAWAENDAEQAAALATRALDLTPNGTAPAVRVSALTTLGAASERLGDRTGRDKLDEAIRIGLAAALRTDVAGAYLELSRAHQLASDWDDARTAAENGAEFARRNGLEFAQASLLSQLAFVLITQGRYREARDAAERAVALASPDTTASTMAKTILADALTMLGEHAVSLALHEELVSQFDRADPDRQVFMLSSRARALLGLGRADQAWDFARNAADLAGTRLRGSAMTAFLVAGDVAEVRGDADAVRWLIDQFEARFAAWDNPAVAVVHSELTAILTKCEGMDSADAFAEAARGHAALGVPVRAAYRRATSAIARLARRRERASARAELESIRAELSERGALRYLKTIDAALTTKARNDVPRSDILNDRELQVALLLGQGLTDARIASQLGVSRRQAAASVAAVLATLGLSRRSQVAAWVVQRSRTAAAAGVRSTRT